MKTSRYLNNIGLEDLEVPLQYRTSGPRGTSIISDLRTYGYPMIDDPVRVDWRIPIRKFSSYRRTVETAQFFWKELFEKFSSLKRTVRVVQFIRKELLEKFSSFKRTVRVVQFIWKELFEKVRFVELNCSNSSVRGSERFEQFISSELELNLSTPIRFRNILIHYRSVITVFFYSLFKNFLFNNNKTKIYQTSTWWYCW